MSKKNTSNTNKKRKKNPIVTIIKGIYKIFDKILITPLSRIVYKINKIIRKNAGLLESALNRSYSLLIISLILAVVAYLLVDSKAINLVETEAEILYNQPLSVIYNEEKYVVDGIPESVDIILMGRKSDLYLAKQLGEYEVVLDLSDYKTGEYNVKLKYNYNTSVGSVTYKLDPSSVTVKINEKISSVRTLTYDLLNQDKLDSKLNVSDVTLDTSQVYIKGSSDTLNKVASVKTLVDVSTLELTEAGTVSVDSLPMVAYDESGKIIENVEIVPSTASATITVNSDYVDLPVKIVPIGTMATGYSISSLNSSVTTVRVYGDRSIITNLGSVTAEIDVDGLNEDKKYNVAFIKPAGIRYMNETTTTINVKVAEEKTAELEGVSVIVKGLSNGLVAQTVNQSDTTVTVILKGSSKSLENITVKNVTAFIDLTGYSTGTYDVPLQVEGQDLTVNYSANVKTIKVKIN